MAHAFRSSDRTASEFGARLGRGLAVLLASTALCAPALAQELPGGGQVAAGGVTIGTPQGGSLGVVQHTPRAVVNWDSFSVGSGGTVGIRQPSANSALLNRVTGALPSRIDGSVSANGQVFVVNRNGVVVGAGGRVEAQGFVASTLDVATGDFMAGNLSFRGTGSSAAVRNSGVIDIGPGGFAALLGGRVSNDGLVRVPLGRIGFGAGERATLDLSGDRFLQVALPSGDDGDPAALIENAGRVQADGGMVEMQAAVARDAARHAINLSGVVEARTVGGRSGAVVLGGGGGRVTVSGAVRATAPARPAATVVAQAPRPAPRPERGGEITVTGAEIALQGAELDASGTGGGGTIRVGGDLRGGGDLPRSMGVLVDAGTRIAADATARGDGGSVVVWSDGRTGFAGRISARGGAEGGDGGLAEVSGKRQLTYAGTVDLSAARGGFGDLLLDPYNVFIEEIPGVTCDATGCTPSGTQNGFFNGGSPNTFSPFGEDSVIDPDALELALGSANVTLTTTNDSIPGGQDGNITVGAALSWTSATTLTFDTNTSESGAVGNVIIAAPIQATSGGLAIDALGTVTTPDGWTDSSGAAQTGGNGAIDVRTFTMIAGDWVQSGPALPAFDAPFFNLSVGSFRRDTGGDGATTPRGIVDIYGLQGIGSRADYLALDYVLGNDIDGANTGNWNFGPGFLSIGSAATPFTGSLDGGGNAILSVVQDRPEGGDFGLFGAIGTGGSVSDVALNGLDMLGENGGALATRNDGSVSGVTVDAATALEGYGTAVGGLVGTSTGTIDNVQVAADLNFNPFTPSGAVTLGGVVGTNTGSVSDATFAGLVFTDMQTEFDVDIGGIAGLNGGTITGSAISGDVDAAVLPVDSPVTATLGGIAGRNAGTVRDSAQTGGGIALNGLIEGSGDFLTFEVGGIAGANEGTVTDSDSGGAVLVDAGTVQSGVAAGGLVGRNYAGATLADGTAGASVVVSASTGDVAVGGIVGRAGGSNTALTFAGQIGVQGGGDTSSIGGLAGTVEAGATLADSQALATSGFSDISVDRTMALGGGVGTAAGDLSDLTLDTQFLSVAGFSASDVGGAVGRLEPGGTLARTRVRSAAIDVTLEGTLAEHTVGGLVGRAAAGSSIADGLALSPIEVLNFGSENAYFVGGLVGLSEGADVARAAFGRADGTGAGISFSEEGSLSDVTAGGLVGEAIGGSFADTYATGGVTVGADGDVLAGGGAGALSGGAVLSRSFATGAVSASSFGSGGSVQTGGLVALAGPGGATVQDAYWDSDTTGEATSAGGTALTTAELQSTDDFPAVAPWDFAGVWAPGAAGFYPDLYTISPVLFARADDQSAVYGTAGSVTPTGTVTGGPGLYVFDADGSTLTSAPGFAVQGLGAGNVGSYAITTDGTPATGSDGTTFRVVDGAGALTVTPRALTVTANDAAKVYGETFTFNGTEFSTSGLVSGESVDTVVLSSDGAASGASVAGSPYAIAVSDAQGSGFDATNYAISYVNGALVVAPRGLTVTADDLSKVYGETVTFTGSEFSTAGLLAGETVGSVTLSSAGAAAGAGVAGSPYAITVSNAAGGTFDAANYAITYVDGSLSVTPRALTVTADDATKTYGDTLALAGTEFTAAGLLAGENIDRVTLSSDGAGAGASVASGPYAITVSGAAGSTFDAANYDIAYVNGTLTVTPRALVVTALDASKVYGDTLTFAGTEFTAQGLATGDTIDGVTLTSAGAAAGAQVAGSPYAIAISNADGSAFDPSNYAISYVGGRLTVTPKALTIVLADRAKQYGTALDLSTSPFTAQGLVAGDSVTAVTVDSAGAPAEAPVGGAPYALTGTGASGTGLGNYTIGFTPAELDVTPAPLRIVVLDQRRVQGQPFTLDESAVEVSGLAPFDRIDRVALDSAGADPAASPSGSPYAITVTDISGDGLDDGEGTSNYAVTVVPGRLTVDGIATGGFLPPRPVLDRQDGLPNPPDRLVLTTVQPPAGSTAITTLDQAQAALAVAREASDTLEVAAANCRQSGGSAPDFLACLADAFDGYSRTLAEAAQDLPGALGPLAGLMSDLRDEIAQIGSSAEIRLQGATTDAQRRRIERDAIGQARAAVARTQDRVRNTIELLRSDDPELAAVQTETGAVVIDALATVDTELLRVADL